MTTAKGSGEKEKLVHQGAINDNESGLLKPATSKKWLFIGYLCNLVAMLCESVSVSCTQALGGYVPAFELNALRFGLVWFASTFMVLIARWDILPKREHIGGVALLSLAVNGFNFAFYEATIYLPVGEVVGTSLVVSAAIVAVVMCVINKGCKVHINVAVLISVAGVFLLAQPSFIFSNSAKSVSYPLCYRHSELETPLCNTTSETGSTDYGNATTRGPFFDLKNKLIGPLDANKSVGCNDTQTNDVKKMSISNEIKGYWCVLLAGICYSLLALIPRLMLSNSNPFVATFWVSGSGVLVSLIIMAATEQPTFPDTTTCILLLFGHSTTAAVTSMLSIAGYLLIYPPIGVLIRSFTVVVVAIAQYTVLKDINPGNKNAAEYTGFCLVMASLVAGPVYQVCKEMPANDDESEEFEHVDVD